MLRSALFSHVVRALARSIFPLVTISLVAQVAQAAENSVDNEPSEVTPQPAGEVGAHSRLFSDDLGHATELTTSTGLRIAAQFFDPDRAPEVVVCSAIAGGATDDPAGASGVRRVIAEVLKEGGYRTAGGSDYQDLVSQRGGRSEVVVYADSTVYCTTTPSSELELALWVASSRFSSAALTQENFAAAVASLSAESEQRDAAVHEGRAPVRLRKMAFLGTSSLGNSAFGSPEELEAITLEQVQATHAASYVASRSVIAVVGGGETEALKKYLDKYFLRIKRGEVAANHSFDLVPQHTMRFSMDEDRAAKTPAAWYGWAIPKRKDQQAVHAALSILISENRLGKQVTKGSRPARRISLHYSPEPTEQPTLARLEVIGRFNHALGLVESELTAQLRLLGNAGPTEAELLQYKKSLVDERQAQLTTNLGRAKVLSRGLLDGSSSVDLLAPLGPEYVPDVPTAERIKLVASQLLVEARRSVVEVYPKGWQDPWQAPMPLFHIVEKGQTLGSIALKYGSTVAVIIKMNGISQAKPIYPGDKLKVPRGKVVKERQSRTHQVRRGETLSGLALKYGVKVREIAGANGMGSRQTIRVGETLTIPWPTQVDGSDGPSNPTKTSESSGQTSQSSASSTGKTHQVRAGETLSGIAKTHGIGTVALAQANGISQRAMVKVGQVLNVPAVAAEKVTALPKYGTYTVKPGDTLSAIAKKYGTTVADITVANQMSRKAPIRPGQTIKVPQRSP